MILNLKKQANKITSLLLKVTIKLDRIYINIGNTLQ